MKKILTTIPILFFILSLLSCVDYVQAISYKNGKYQMYYKVTLSKMLFAMTGDDPEEVFNGFDETSIGEIPENVSVDSVNTDLEVGSEFRFSIDPKAYDETEKTFLPKVSGNKCYVPFLLGQNESLADSFGSDGDDYGKTFGEAVLSSAKCRILISKSVIASIEKAYFEGSENHDYVISVYDYGDSHCLEIPFIVVLQQEMYRTDRVVVIKN